MSTIHLHQTTTSTPEQFIAGLTDFGPGRAKLFGNSTDDYLRVHREGVMTTTDSNLWSNRSGHTYTFTRRPDGMTELDAVVVRDGKNIKGRLLGFVLGIFGERVLGKEMAKTVKAIEARNNGSERRNSRRRHAARTDRS